MFWLRNKIFFFLLCSLVSHANFNSLDPQEDDKKNDMYIYFTLNIWTNSFNPGIPSQRSSQSVVTEIGSPSYILKCMFYNLRKNRCIRSDTLNKCGTRLSNVHIPTLAKFANDLEKRFFPFTLNFISFLYNNMCT